MTPLNTDHDMVQAKAPMSINFANPGTADMCRRELQENLEGLYSQRDSVIAQHQEEEAQFETVHRDLTYRIEMIEAACRAYDDQTAQPVPSVPHR